MPSPPGTSPCAMGQLFARPEGKQSGAAGRGWGSLGDISEGRLMFLETVNTVQTPLWFLVTKCKFFFPLGPTCTECPRMSWGFCARCLGGHGLGSSSASHGHVCLRGYQPGKFCHGPLCLRAGSPDGLPWALRLVLCTRAETGLHTRPGTVCGQPGPSRSIPWAGRRRGRRTPRLNPLKRWVHVASQSLVGGGHGPPC